PASDSPQGSPPHHKSCAVVYDGFRTVRGGSFFMPNEKQGLSRRRLFDAVSAAGVAMAATAAANAEPAPQDEAPHLAPLENFKYNIESRKGWQGEAGSAKEATVAEFPISQSIAGVSMRLKPGAIRELHWHSLAAEWAYMLSGRCRATVVD